jgi:Uma2 family endonuclease
MSSPFLQTVPESDRGSTAAPVITLRLQESFDEIVAQNPELRIEQTAAGEIVVMSPTGGENGIRNSALNTQLSIWANRHGGVVFDSSTLFLLPNGARRTPDASWISDDRWSALTPLQRQSYPPIAPDFVVELRSPTDRLADQQEKLEEYMATGVRLGWLIDPLLKQVHIYRPGQPPQILNDPGTVSSDDTLPGLVLQLDRIFLV